MRTFTLKRFLVFSIAIHLISISLLVLINIFDVPEKKPTPMIARLLTPKEAGVIKAMPKRNIAPKILPPIPSASIKNMKKQFLLPSSGNNLSASSKPDSSKINESTSSAKTGSTGSGSLLKRGALFDRGEIFKTAKKHAGTKEKSSVTFASKELKHDSYMLKLKDKIETIWQYPHTAAAKGIYGDLLIAFTIKKDGSLGSVELTRTSGHRDLDDAAIKALREAAPFWPLPEEWQSDAFSINGHFIYTLYGTYIR